MKKRIVSLLLALVMMTSLLPVQVFAADVDAAAEPVVEQQQEEKQKEKQEAAPAQEPAKEEPVQEEPAEEPVKEPEQEAPAKVEEPAQQEQTAQQEPAAQEESGTVGNCSNGYVTDIKFKPSSMAKTYLPDYTFAQAKTYNEITLYNTSMSFAMILSVDENAAANASLGYMFWLDGQPTKPTANEEGAFLKRITDAKKTNCLLSDIVSATYGTHTLSLQVGTVSTDGKSLKSGYDEYVFSFNLLPELTNLTLKDSEQTLTTTPAYNVNARFYDDTFSVGASGETITFSGRYKDNEQVTKCYIGDSEMPLEPTWDSKHVATISTEITLADYADGNSGNCVIPLRLVYEKDDTKLETVTYLEVVNAALAVPKFTQQPDSITCDKLDTPTLTVTAEAPANGNGKLSYQWYSSNTREFTIQMPIEGATDTSYTLTREETSRAGTRFYRCEVTNTYTDDAGNTRPITIRSVAVSVKTLLSFVSAPTIFKELGTFVSTATEKYADIYRTEYTAGNKFDLIYISVEEPEDGVRLSYEYFVNTTPDYDTAELLETTVSEVGIVGDSTTGKTHIITSAKPTEGLAEGTYYIFCKVTASAEGVESASTVSISPKLTFKRIELKGFTGSGTKDAPYQITSEEDFIKIRNYVNVDRQWCKGVYFKMMNDVELSAGWQPIGTKIDMTPDEPDETQKRFDWQAFSGILDGGGHKLTVAEGGKPLFNFTSDAVIENLDIYGKKIDGNGLINGCFIDYGDDNNYWTGVPDCVTIRNVRLLEGSSTRYSGFMEGSGSGKNNILIQNCVIQQGVTIGYGGQSSNIGSFVGGMFNGEISNSYSAATVYGKDNVGGLAAQKGQSIGDCQVVNSHFSGQIIATGDWVGGLIAKGYTDKSAPNTMAVSFINSYVDGDITGHDYVGGLFGGEGGIEQCWNECWLKDSHFYGTITASGDNVGGIIGYMRSIDNRQHIENNYFYEKSGKVTKLIGTIKRYDKTRDFGIKDLAAFEANMGSAKIEKEFKDGTVLALLNEGSDYKNWVQNVKYPTLSADPVVMGLTVSGEFKTKYEMGEALDLTGIRFKATWSDSTSQWLTLADVEQLDEFDPNHLGQQTITFQYGAGTASITVTVYKTYSDADKANFGKATVYFSLSEDGKFMDSGSTTLAGLETTVTYFDLADYGLEAYYCYDAQGNVIEKPTLLHLYIKMLEQYYLGGQKLTVGGKALALSGGAGSMYMTNFWGHDENLMYFVNHEYPLKADSDTIGETADQILLADGDVIEVAMYSDLNFYKDAAAGFPYFADAQGNAVDRSLLKAGQELTLVLYRAPLTMGGGSAKPVIMPNTDVYAADQRTGDVSQWKKIGTTNDKGEIAVKFDEVGDQFLYVAGAVNAKNVAVGSPAICAVRVVEKIYNVTLPSGVKGDTTVAGGDDYIFRLDREDGYTYTVKATVDGKKADVIDNGDGTYTVKNVNGELKITVTKTANGNTGGNTGNKPSQPTTGKDVKSGNTGDAGVTLYVGLGLVAVLAGAVIVIRKRKEN